MEKTEELKFALHTKESAPKESLKILGTVEGKFGFIPNLLRQMAEAPHALQGDVHLLGLFGESSLTATERYIVLLVVGSHCGASYSIAANSTVAKKKGVSLDIIKVVRKQKALSDPKLEALRIFTLEMVQNHGVVSNKTQDRFFEVGFTNQQVLDVILGIALGTVQSYTSLTAKTPIDLQFQQNT